MRAHPDAHGSPASLRVRQVPVHMRERQGGTPSSGPLKSAIYLVRSLFSYGISVSRRREEK